MDPTVIQAATASGTWLWDKYGKHVIKKTAHAARAAWSRFHWDESERRYKKRLLDLYSVTKLLGNPKAIDIDQIYTDVYVLDKITAYKRLSIEELETQVKERSTFPISVIRFELLAIAKTTPRLYLLGKPGAGKSTFLKSVVLQCCKGNIDKTPIFVPLKQWADSRLDLMTFLAHEFDVCAFPDAAPFINQLLESGRAVVLFDGLDEVPHQGRKRNETIRALTDFARKYRSTNIIVTCRIAATDYSFDTFKYLEISDFSPEQQEHFIGKWYRDDKGKFDRFLTEWSKPDSHGLRELAKTPILLALMCLAYDEILSFPKRRVDLYQEALNALLRKWDASRGIIRDEIYRFLSPVRKEQLLMRIAAQAFFSKQVFMPKAKLIRMTEEYLIQLPDDDRNHDVDGESVVRAIEAQHGLLVERAVGIYSFSHLTFQEYFAARYLVENAASGILEEKTLAHAEDDQWREVFLNVASMLDDAERFLTTFCQVMRRSVENYPNVLRLLREIDKVSNSPYIVDSSTMIYPRSRTKGAKHLDVAPHQSPELLDETVTLAGNLHFMKGSENALRRTRCLAATLQHSRSIIQDLLGNDLKSIRRFEAFMATTILLSECLQVAVLSDRARFVDMILSPDSDIALDLGNDR